MGKRLKADIKRAKTYKACKKIADKAVYGPISDWLIAINAKIDQDILKSVLVCGTDCLTVSFATEVGNVRKLLNKASKMTQGYAKKVVKCAGVVRVGGGTSGGASTKDALDKAVNDTKKIVNNCKVCKH